MCTESTQFYRGSGSNFHTNSMRQWATLPRQQQGDRLHIETGISAASHAPMTAEVASATKKNGVTVMKMPKAAPVPTMVKLSQEEAE